MEKEMQKLTKDELIDWLRDKLIELMAVFTP